MSERFALNGKTTLVTGASSGLGAHFAQVLASAGAEVVIAARRTEPLQALAARIKANGGRCSTVSLDVASSESIAALAPVLDRVDILVNNAGIVREAPLLDQSESD